jgi:hypothetical protein
MPRLSPRESAAGREPWAEQRSEAAAALIKRFGPDGVAWLDRFLADYVFEGEPLDQIVVAARELGKLPARRKRRSFHDD